MKVDRLISRRRILGMGLACATPFIFEASSSQAAKVPRSLGPSTRRTVDIVTGEKPGTVLISNGQRTLDVVHDARTVERYTVGIGRPGFTWTGTVTVGQKTEWPSWTPPAEMRQRQPDLPDMVPPGPFNPLGARALYLYRSGHDTLFRIHGTNDAATIGGYVTSGCFRMTNADILYLYPRVPIGTKVIVRT
jgi:lipoprotein-anchoring transpeptidase ErfK/SrfK